MKTLSCGLVALCLVAASCAVGENSKGLPSAHAPDTSGVIEGVVYWGPSSKDPVDRAFVHITDSSNATRCLVTGCDGKFSLPAAAALALTLPLRIAVERSEEPELRAPTTLAYRQMYLSLDGVGACASCHATAETPVHLYDSEEEAAASKLAPTGSCAPGAMPDVVECPENRL